MFLNKEYISSSESICQEVASYLRVHHILNESNDSGATVIYTTGDPHEFRYSSEGFFHYHDLKVNFLDYNAHHF
ncbi:MAG: hypothetical protein ACLRHW_04445 [Coprobacillus cateniformis]